MNPNKLDKFEPRIPAAAVEQKTPVLVVDLDASEVGKRQIAFIARRCGLSADRARLIVPLVFGGGAT